MSRKKRTAAPQRPGRTGWRRLHLLQVGTSDYGQAQSDNIQFMKNSDKLPRFPTMDEVEKADHEQLARWYRFLSFYTPEQKKIVDRMVARFKQMGGMTPALSKKIGH